MSTKPDSDSQNYPGASGGSAAGPCSAWVPVSESSMPAMGQIVWLWDGQQIWIGGRDDSGEGWLWGNTYGTIWWQGEDWDGDLEDDDYAPTHWMPLPNPPNVPAVAPATLDSESTKDVMAG